MGSPATSIISLLPSVIGISGFIFSLLIVVIVVNTILRNMGIGFIIRIVLDIIAFVIINFIVQAICDFGIVLIINMLN